MRLRCAWVLLSGALAAPSFAQTVTGTLQGTVTDASGGVLPGATVTIRNVDLGTSRDVTTNAVGFYVAPFLPIGTYTVGASLNGFTTLVREAVPITLNQTQVADFQLKPAARAETITVTGAAPPINSTNAAVKSSLDEQQIADKPTLNPGSFLSLAEIFPGFQDNPTSGQNNPTASSGSSINFNGTGTRAATFQIDGVNNDDSSENQHRQGAALSTIKEFQVLSNTYSAEFGRGFGAVVLVQTKSGTNVWHGDDYEFFRDSSRLTALRKFALTKPDNQRHQFGGTVGFPILQNRLFGFASLDRTRLQGTSNYSRDLFLASEVARPWLTRGNDTPQNRAWIASILARYPAGATPNDPRSNRTYATVTGINQPDGDYSGRADWQLGRDSLVARYQYTHQIRESNDVIVGETTRQNNKQQNLGVTWTKIYRNNLLGEFRYGLGLRRTRVNIAAGNDTPIVRFTGSPVASTTLGSSGAFPIDRDQRDHQFVYNVSWLVARNHNVKVGTDLRRQDLDDFADSNSRGVWTFNASCGGTTYATAYEAMLDGCIASFAKSWGPFYLENRFLESNVYAEDNWRITPSLTFNLGFRHEYVSAPTERANRIDYIFHNDTDNYEPRIGAAWTPPASADWLRWLTGEMQGDSSVRGGYGLFHGRIFQSVFSQNGASIRTNPPSSLSRTISTLPGILNVSDPTQGFVFAPGLPTGRYTIVVPNEHLEMPYTHQWSASYERKLPLNSTMRISYNGNHAIGTLRYTNDNLPRSPLEGPITVANHPNNAPAAGFPDLRGKVIDRIAADAQCAGTGFFGLATTAACPNAVPIADNEISLRVPRTAERRPDPRYGTNTLISNGAEAWYEGVQVEWTKRLSDGLSFTASYTRSKAEDTTSEATFVGAGDSNALGPNKEYAKGYSRFHTPHRFTFNGSYRLPLWTDRPDLVGTLAGGWQVSSTIKLASGTPFTVTQTGIDLNFDGFSEGRPIILDRSILGRSVDDPARSTERLPLSAFRLVTISDSFENIVARNTFFGQGIANVDLGLFKNFRLASSRALSVRVEVYNLFNRVQYGFPATSLSTPSTFGQITAVHELYIPRTAQIGFRFRF